MARCVPDRVGKTGRSRSVRLRRPLKNVPSRDQNLFASHQRCRSNRLRCGYPYGFREGENGLPDAETFGTVRTNHQSQFESGDVVLDPSCGCATTCIAAERLDRHWIGIDLSALAVKLVEQRARNELGLMGGVQAISRTDIPLRTDRESAPPLSESKVVLYGTQGGNCNGCGTHFLPQHLTVDHIVAQSKGGTSHLDNLQLLCGHCNSLKGNRADGVFAGAVGEGCLREDYFDGQRFRVSLL